jgi:hypothetical protein
MVWFMFAILGVSLFSNRLIYCSTSESNPYKIVSNKDCIKSGGYWKVYPLNFDTVGNSLLVLLIVSSLNNWDELMYHAIDSSGEDTGPIEGLYPEFGYFYLGFILIGAFFFLNFLIGVLFLNFKTMQKQHL